MFIKIVYFVRNYDISVRFPLPRSSDVRTVMKMTCVYLFVYIFVVVKNCGKIQINFSLVVFKRFTMFFGRNLNKFFLGSKFGSLRKYGRLCKFLKNFKKRGLLFPQTFSYLGEELWLSCVNFWLF